MAIFQKRGWRLPAPQLESAVAELVRQKLNEPGFPVRLLPEADTGLIKNISSRLSRIRDSEVLAAMIERIDIASGVLTAAIGATRPAKFHGVDAIPISAEALAIRAAFQSRKRGVETKLILGDVLKEIAQSAGTSKRRVQQMIDLAYLAPDNRVSRKPPRETCGLDGADMARSAGL